MVKVSVNRVRQIIREELARMNEVITIDKSAIPNAKGRGKWAFLIKKDIFWHTGTYSDAQKAAKEKAKEAGVSFIKLLP